MTRVRQTISVFMAVTAFTCFSACDDGAKSPAATSPAAAPAEGAAPPPEAAPVKAAVVPAAKPAAEKPATGATHEEARARAYRGVSAIHFRGKHFRLDIGA